MASMYMAHTVRTRRRFVELADDLVKRIQSVIPKRVVNMPS